MSYDGGRASRQEDVQQSTGMFKLQLVFQVWMLKGLRGSK
jgi:hypothetical protein